MKNEKKIYFPHNLDFRGRAYTMHVHLNHIGSDLCRGLLRFEEKKPLGERGPRWMHIQCATLFGNGADKLPMDERVQFIKDHIDEVRASAQDPLASDAWWQDAEEPWQCLATCIRARQGVRARGSHRSLRVTSPCIRMVRATVCSTTPRSAATCTGKPSTWFLRIEELACTRESHRVLKRIVAEDMKLIDSTDEDDVATAKLAMALAQHIDRKLVKQTVMTSVYGVTFMTRAAHADQSNSRKREASGGQRVTPLPRRQLRGEEDARRAEQHVYQRSRRHGLAHAVCDDRHAGEPVRWTTPLGLPVVQPYHRQSKKRVRTILQSFSLKSDGDGEPVMKVKQRSAFPPNYIHSIDSSHMMKTAVACVDAGSRSRACTTRSGHTRETWMR